ncbi:Aminopeptidase N [Papilio xuthus]|uniref:Aminopeptidase n=1 Tax=Papilio xuthus TaxID=66420 RepID=A0A194QEJ6_PAPXU|nr:Aminopeptidase N [Papilio xuthus]
MYLLLLVSLLGSALCVPLDTDNDVTRNANYEHYLLPGESYPTFYDVRLFLNPDVTDNFRGEVTIRIVPRRTTNQIVLQAMEMQIDSIRLTRSDSLQQNLFLNFVQATDDTHFLTINSNTPLVMGLTYIVDISYTSRFAENMFGVYISTYEEPGVGTQRLITSQLQPTFSRRAFPCYDEPAYKAIFRTTIYAPPAYPVVRSNMPERTDLLKPEVAGYRKFEFQDTLMMSSYLLAYLVSKFEYVTNEASPLYNVPFRVYSRPGTQNTATFALDFGQRNMIALENYTEFTYAFPKMDKAAVPDFAAGAMENWGLVIYREVALLVRDGITTTNTRQNIGRIICHENVHMWFGNEVSPTTWTYTWLNEGFANFFENFATDLVLPEWRMMDQFVLLLQNVFQNDAVLGVNPMTHPVYTPSQIIGTFNAVAYQKSGSVIRMMQHFLTPEVFRRGLIIYLRNKHVPINWVLSTNADFSNTSPQGWVPPTFPAVSFDIPGLSSADWYIVNKQQTGYYRVNYDVENWQALARVLNSSHQTIHVLNRAQIVDDSFNLARNGRLNYVHAFEISRYLVQEADYIPWASANSALNYLDIVLSGSDVYDLFKTYMLELSTPLYERLGFSSQLPEEHVTAYHRNIVLDIHCRLGNQHCVNRSQELLEQFRNNPSQRLNPDVQTTVFCSGLRGGDVNNFNFLWNQYLASTDSSEQSILLNALGCTSNAERRDFYLNQVISATSAVRDQDRHSVIVSVINSSPENMEVALDFVIEHFAAIQPRVQGLTGTTNILNAFARRLTTRQHATKIETFISRHQSIFTAGELAAIGAIQENIAASIAWSEQNYATVSSWLNDNFRSSANVVTSSLLILISIFIAVYNI